MPLRVPFSIIVCLPAHFLTFGFVGRSKVCVIFLLLASRGNVRMEFQHSALYCVYGTLIQCYVVFVTYSVVWIVCIQGYDVWKSHAQFYNTCMIPNDLYVVCNILENQVISETLRGNS